MFSIFAIDIYKMKAELIIQIDGVDLGEGPVWDHTLNVLRWVDITSGMLYSYNPESHENIGYKFDQMLGAAIPTNKGNLILALQNGLAFFNEKLEELNYIIDPESNKPQNRFNDAKCDPNGRLWAGTMNINPPHKPEGSLYMLDNDLELTKKLTNIGISNGLGWNKNGNKFFYIDTVLSKIRSFDYDIVNGNLHNEKDLVKFDNESPDGMAVDANDNLWVAFYMGSKVVCFDSITGEVLNRVDVPAMCVTSCAFGGKDLETLYITSAYKEGDLLSGGLFAVSPGVKGRRSDFFKEI